MTFGPLALAGTAQAAIKNVANLALHPPLSSPIHRAGEGRTAGRDRALEEDVFIREPPTFKVTLNTPAAGGLSPRRHPTQQVPSALRRFRPLSVPCCTCSA